MGAAIGEILGSAVGVAISPVPEPACAGRTGGHAVMAVVFVVLGAKVLGDGISIVA